MENQTQKILRQPVQDAVSFVIDMITLKDGEIVMDIEVNERNVTFKLDEQLFNDWFTKGTNRYSWVQEYRDGDNDRDVLGEMHINEWWMDIVEEHKKAVSEFIKQDGYLKGALLAQYWHDTILYGDLANDILKGALDNFQGLIRDMFATLMHYNFNKDLQFKYTKEIKIC